MSLLKLLTPFFAAAVCHGHAFAAATATSALNGHDLLHFLSLGSESAIVSSGGIGKLVSGKSNATQIAMASLWSTVHSSAVDDVVRVLAAWQRVSGNVNATATRIGSALRMASMWSAVHSSVRSWDASRLRAAAKDLMSRYLGWNKWGDAYSPSASKWSQDGWDAQTLYFLFISVASNSFAVGFGLKAALSGVHPKFHFSAKMARSMAFHIVIGSLEFVWVVIMYLSVPRWWHSAVLVLLDSVQNATIWVQVGSSQGVKLVTNSCYLFCLAVKAAMCCALILVDPFSRDLVWGIYEILSAFTLTRICGMSFKTLGLFQGQMYTLAVFTGTMVSAAQAFGHCGPFALYLFLVAYSAAHRQPTAKRAKRAKKSAPSASQPVAWTQEAQRNPFRGDEAMATVTALLKEGDDERLGPRERARVVFRVITKREGAQWMTRGQLAAVLCPSGVPLAEVERSFAELSSGDGIHFETFYAKLPTVWNWYFEYLYCSVFAPETQIR